MVLGGGREKLSPVGQQAERKGDASTSLDSSIFFSYYSQVSNPWDGAAHTQVRSSCSINLSGNVLAETSLTNVLGDF